MLGENNQRRVTYLSISHGKVTQGPKQNQKLYDFVEGYPVKLQLKDSVFGNEIVKRWYLEIEDGDETFCICLPYSSGIFKSIILSLAALPTLNRATRIKVEPYEGKNGYTKVVVTADGVKLDWITKTLPPVEMVMVGDKSIKDDTKQMEVIVSYARDVAKKIMTK